MATTIESQLDAALGISPRAEYWQLRFGIFDILLCSDDVGHHRFPLLGYLCVASLEVVATLSRAATACPRDLTGNVVNREVNMACTIHPS